MDKVVSLPEKTYDYSWGKNISKIIFRLLTLFLVSIEISTACSRSCVVGVRGVGSTGSGAVSFFSRSK